MRCNRCLTNWPDELIPLMKFCASCAAPFGQAPSTIIAEEVRGELRFVTILFADMVDFTSFSEERSPDEVARVISSLLVRLTRVIERCGGTVEKYIGDAVMATFGLPRADSTATRNAVRAALLMQQSTTEFSNEESMNLRIRVGIHTGEVMYCRIGNNWTVLGDAVNTASRLQTAAPPGKVWVSSEVNHEVRRFFSLNLKPAVTMKGKKQSVQPYEATKERDTPTLDLPRFVGRTKELTQVQNFIARSLDQKGFNLLVLRGALGMGKSRLLRELQEWLEKEDTTFRLDTVQYDHSDRFPAHGLNLLVRSRFALLTQNLNEEMILAGLRERLPEENPFVPVEQRELTVEFFAFILGILKEEFRIESMDGKEKWSGAFIELKRWLEGWAQKTPWVWMLEDIPNGDAQTLSFIEWALNLEWSAPVIVVATIRDEDFDEGSHWYSPLERWRKAGKVEEIELKEIDPETLAPALSMMTEGELSAEEAKRIAIHTEGNPLFATELVLFLKEQGILAREVNWAKFILPGTIREVMEARLERLGAQGKEVAKRGALIGRRFSTQAVKRIWDRPEEEMEEGFHVLRETETIYAESSKLFSGEEENVFRYGRLQETALARIPREERVRWLGSLANWALDELEVAGDRWEVAGPMLIPLIIRAKEARGEQWEASLWWEVLGLLHRKYHRTIEAVESFLEAVKVATGVRRLVIYRLIAEVEDFNGAYEQGLKTLARAEIASLNDHKVEEIPVALKDKFAALHREAFDRWEKITLNEAKISIALVKAEVFIHLARIPEAEEVFLAVEKQLAGIKGIVASLFWLRWGKGWAWAMANFLGRPSDAELICAEVRRHINVQATELTEQYLAFLSSEATVALRLGDYSRVQQITRQRLSAAQASGDRRAEGNAWNVQGSAHFGSGELEAAKQAFDRFLANCQLIGDRSGEMLCLHNLGAMSYEQGDWELATKYQERFMALGRVIGNHSVESYGRLALSNIVQTIGKYEEAISLLNQAKEIAQKRRWPRLIAFAEVRLQQVAVLQAIEAHDLSRLRRTILDLEKSEEIWGEGEDAGEAYMYLIAAQTLLGEETEAVIKRARERIPSSAILSRAWLDLAEATAKGQSSDEARNWFQRRGFVRALELCERLTHFPINQPSEK